jgi:hypothetical protein
VKFHAPIVVLRTMKERVLHEAIPPSKCWKNSSVSLDVGLSTHHSIVGEAVFREALHKIAIIFDAQVK